MRKGFQISLPVLLALVAFAPSRAGAVTPKIDVSTADVTCRTVFGTVKFAPVLVPFGTVAPEKIKIKGTIDGCTVTNAPSPVTILASTFSGTLESANNNALNLLTLNAVTGTIVVKWKADKTTPIMQTTSVITPNATCGGQFAPGGAFGTTQYSSFHIGAQASCGTAGAQPAPSVSGAFAGNDAGATSTTDAITSQNTANITTQANGPGVKGVNLGIGTFTLQ